MSFRPALAMYARLLPLIVVVGWLCTSNVLAAEPVTLKLRIVPGDWGNAPEADIEAVCRSAAKEILQHCGERQLDPISLRYDKQGPMVVYGLGDSGERRVLLNARDTYWSQFAYQFSHEVGHILCNYRDGNRENLWFEESLCEAASLFALRSMAKSWETQPPYPNWKDYSQSLAKYADDRLAAVPPLKEKSLAAWYRANELHLRKNPTDRPLNQQVAVQLLKLLEKQPKHWQTLEQLNKSPADQSLSFAEYLRDWHHRVPQEHQPFVASIAELFEIDL